MKKYIQKGQNQEYEKLVYKLQTLQKIYFYIKFGYNFLYKTLLIKKKITYFISI